MSKSINQEQNEFVANYDFKLFSYEKGFEVDGTINEEDCELCIFNENNNQELFVIYENKKIKVVFEDKVINEFDFCKNFEEKIWETYQKI